MDSDRVTGTAKKVGGKIESAVGDFVGDGQTQAEGAVDQVKGAAQAAIGQAKDKARDYADAAYDAAGEAYETGRRYVDEGRQRLPDAADKYFQDGRRAVSRQVEESPVAALLVAGAVGYLLALLVHGRK